jgi:hypothetical protein
VNVFGAAVLASAHGLDESVVGRILADGDPGHFLFGDDGFCWGELRTSVEQIAAARQHFASAFGSCSFDQPREELRALGWL